MMIMIPIVVTLAGIVTDVSIVQNSKAFLLIVVTLVGIMMLVIGHCVYCKIVILVVVMGIVTVVETISVYRFIPGTV